VLHGKLPRASIVCDVRVVGFGQIDHFALGIALGVKHLVLGFTQKTFFVSQTRKKMACRASKRRT
jgi:hypothetical protein